MKVIALPQNVGQTPFCEMVLATVAQHLLQESRSKSDLEAQLLTNQITQLSYIVEVYDCRSEGRPIPESPSGRLGGYPKYEEKAYLLPPDRIVKAIPVRDGRQEAVDMIHEHHLRRFLAGEESRANLISYGLKKKISGLMKEIEAFIQAGELK